MIITCPHCNIFIEVVELNCKIFRCAIYKDTFQQVNPHATKEECANAVKRGIYGCSLPFKIVGDIAVKCDYI